MRIVSRRSLSRLIDVVRESLYPIYKKMTVTYKVAQPVVTRENKPMIFSDSYGVPVSAERVAHDDSNFLEVKRVKLFYEGSGSTVIENFGEFGIIGSVSSVTKTVRHVIVEHWGPFFILPAGGEEGVPSEYCFKYNDINYQNISKTIARRIYKSLNVYYEELTDEYTIISMKDVQGGMLVSFKADDIDVLISKSPKITSNGNVFSQFTVVRRHGNHATLKYSAGPASMAEKKFLKVAEETPIAVKYIGSGMSIENMYYNGFPPTFRYAVGLFAEEAIICNDGAMLPVGDVSIEVECKCKGARYYKPEVVAEVDGGGVFVEGNSVYGRDNIQVGPWPMRPVATSEVYATGYSVTASSASMGNGYSYDVSISGVARQISFKDYVAVLFRGGVFQSVLHVINEEFSNGGSHGCNSLVTPMEGDEIRFYVRNKFDKRVDHGGVVAIDDGYDFSYNTTKPDKIRVELVGDWKSAKIHKIGVKTV